MIALVLAAFAILFGARHTDATEHQRGLMLAVAVESMVKLAAFLAVGGIHRLLGVRRYRSAHASSRGQT